WLRGEMRRKPCVSLNKRARVRGRRVRLMVDELEPIVAPSTTINGALSNTDAASHDRSGAFADYYSLTGAGSTTITMTGFDTYLYLYDSSLHQVAFDDDGANDGNGGSRIVFNLTVGQTYYIEATSFASVVTGNYALTVTTGTVTAVSNPFS